MVLVFGMVLSLLTSSVGASFKTMAIPVLFPEPAGRLKFSGSLWLE
jgi:hypothetical protein